ncbi:hypothetical protein RV11_GL000032 [Enterococcus phoeniculicola]|jgi:hypothetical protein|uniref:Uncharacterized protein n=1 Tax=Enterococcus phoeniculicola ATCC BAA-412 TaxID=1158610 RepID=R3TVC0_9ENTE|nr:hypothetical protein [Enterococcus phoeniculicola]EOL45529.1 hypothetical protein UC3_01419 [Enterococcus phoeniculicola ATCC BAA-412]EOT74891.1 hypothetical protein I589_02491 [Enterococcus phoeniculicola ATCC BAA-412]OJG73666.1 hypothetical protein RV11_GL000032 [Enterococcus phoeniculicola]
MMKIFKKKKLSENPFQQSSFKKYFGLSIGFWELYSKIDKETGVNISKETVHKIYKQVLALQEKNVVFDPSIEEYDTTLKIHMKDGLLIIYGNWNMNEEETIDEIIGARLYEYEDRT